MRNVSDVIKPAFPDAEYVKVENLIDATLFFKGFALSAGDKGDYLVVLVEHDKKLKSFSCGGKVVISKLQQIADFDKVEPNDFKVVMFKESLQGKLIEQKSGKGMTYYDLVDSETTKKEK